MGFWFLMGGLKGLRMATRTCPDGTRQHLMASSWVPVPALLLKAGTGRQHVCLQGDPWQSQESGNPGQARAGEEGESPEPSPAAPSGGHSWT